MRDKLIDLAAHLLAKIAVAVFIICCLPYIVFVCIREAYRDDNENARMHRDIEQFLKKQDDDEYDYSQAHTW